MYAEGRENVSIGTKLGVPNRLCAFIYLLLLYIYILLKGNCK